MPFCRVTVIVNGPGLGDGEVGADDPPHAAAIAISIRDDEPTRILRMSTPVSPRRAQVHSKTDTR